MCTVGGRGNDEVVTKAVSIFVSKFKVICDCTGDRLVHFISKREDAHVLHVPVYVSCSDVTGEW